MTSAFGQQPSPNTVTDNYSYDYLNYTPYELRTAFRRLADKETKIIDEETSMICKNSDYLKIDPDKFAEDDMRSIMNLYMKCKINTIKKYGKQLESNTIDSWNAIFTKIAGTNVTPINSGVNGTISRGNMDGKSVIIKTGKDISKSKELIHEYTIGLYLNTLHTALDNFPLVYGILPACTLPYIAKFGQKSYLLNSCNQSSWMSNFKSSEPKRIGTSAHLIMEDLGNNTITLFTLITSWSAELDKANDQAYETMRNNIISDYYTIMFQIYCALATAYRYLKFVHGDLHTSNILVEKLPNAKTLEYQLSSTVIRITTRYLIKIIDYGYASISVNCNSFSDGRSYGNSQYKTYASDSLSGVSVPWIDVYRITGLSALNIKGYVVGKQTYQELMASNDNEKTLPFIVASSFLFGLITKYPKDVVKREYEIEDEDFKKIIKSGITTINRNNKRNEYFLTNMLASNLPSAECAAFMMLRNTYIFEQIKDKVSTTNTRLFYNSLSFNIPNLEDYSDNNYYINDDFDMALAIKMNENKGANKSNRLQIISETPFNDRVEKFLKYFVIQRTNAILSLIGDESKSLSKTKEPKNEFMIDHMKAVNSGITGKANDDYYFYSDVFMLILDTALIAKTEVELMIDNLNKMNNKDDVNMELFNELIQRSNAIIDKMNNIFSSLTGELYIMLVKFETSQMKKYIREWYTIYEKYPDNYEELYFKYVDYIKNKLIKNNPVVKGKYRYIRFTNGLLQSQRRSFVELITEMMAYYYNESNDEANSNNESFIFKILTFEPVTLIGSETQPSDSFMTVDEESTEFFTDVDNTDVDNTDVDSVDSVDSNAMDVSDNVLFRQ